MTPLQHIELHKDEFTKSELKIMEYVLEHLKEISTNPISNIAEQCNVSKSALLRFCQKCGYKGYSEFKYEVSRYLQSIVNFGDANANKSQVLIDLYTEQLNNIPQTISSKVMDDFFQLIHNARKIKIFGVHETGLSAQYFSYRLGSLGIDSESVTYPSFFVEKAVLGNKEDLHIFLSLSAETSVIKEALQSSFENHCKTVLLTQNDHHKYKQKANLSLLLPTFNYNQQSMFLDSQALLFVSIDLLINHLASKLSMKNEVDAAFPSPCL